MTVFVFWPVLGSRQILSRVFKTSFCAWASRCDVGSSRRRRSADLARMKARDIATRCHWNERDIRSDRTSARGCTHLSARQPLPLILRLRSRKRTVPKRAHTEAHALKVRVQPSRKRVHKFPRTASYGCFPDSMVSKPASYIAYTHVLAHCCIQSREYLKERSHMLVVIVGVQLAYVYVVDEKLRWHLRRKGRIKIEDP